MAAFVFPLAVSVVLTERTDDLDYPTVQGELKIGDVVVFTTSMEGSYWAYPHYHEMAVEEVLGAFAKALGS